MKHNTWLKWVNLLQKNLEKFRFYTLAATLRIEAAMLSGQIIVQIQQ